MIISRYKQTTWEESFSNEITNRLNCVIGAEEHIMGTYHLEATDLDG